MKHRSNGIVVANKGQDHEVTRHKLLNACKYPTLRCTDVINIFHHLTSRKSSNNVYDFASNQPTLLSNGQYLKTNY